MRVSVTLVINERDMIVKCGDDDDDDDAMVE